MIQNVFWVKVKKQDVLACLKAAGFDVLFKQQDAPELYDIEDSSTGISMAGAVLYDAEMIVWLTPAYPFNQARIPCQVFQLGKGLSKRFSVLAYYGDIDFRDALNEINSPALYPHRTFQYVKLDRPRISVDFNEICGEDLYLLSQVDAVIDSEGQVVRLEEGLPVFLYNDDEDENGQYNPILANAVVVKNHLQHYSHVRWLARLLPNDRDGSEPNGFLYWLSDIEEGAL